jgi:hypothetical protein
MEMTGIELAKWKERNVNEEVVDILKSVQFTIRNIGNLIS